LRIAPPWATWTVVLAALLVVAAIAGACVASVEVTSLGRGMLQAQGSPQILATQIAGTVTSVAVHPGDTVTAGQELARLDSTTLATALLEASRKLELKSRSLQNFRDRQGPLYAASLARKHDQFRLLQQRAESESGSVLRMAKKATAMENMKAEGLANVFESEDAAERIEVARREELRAQEEGARIREQIAATSAGVALEEWNLLMQVEEARAQRDSLQLALDAAIVRSPIDGVMGPVSVRPGDTLLAGAPIGRVLSAGAPRTVVVYLPERDRAFVESGAPVRVEVDQLPAWELGALSGRVTRIAAEIASESDLRDTLGDPVKLHEPMVRVDVALEEDAAYATLRDRLRPQSLANVRFVLRERRVISLLFEPLQRGLH
jgi:multidrug resistance efflux pump